MLLTCVQLKLMLLSVEAVALSPEALPTAEAKQPADTDEKIISSARIKLRPLKDVFFIKSLQILIKLSDNSCAALSD